MEADKRTKICLMKMNRRKRLPRKQGRISQKPEYQVLVTQNIYIYIKLIWYVYVHEKIKMILHISKSPLSLRSRKRVEERTLANCRKQISKAGQKMVTKRCQPETCVRIRRNVP